MESLQRCVILQSPRCEWICHSQAIRTDPTPSRQNNRIYFINRVYYQRNPQNAHPYVSSRRYEPSSVKIRRPLLLTL